MAIFVCSVTVVTIVTVFFFVLFIFPFSVVLFCIIFLLLSRVFRFSHIRGRCRRQNNKIYIKMLISKSHNIQNALHSKWFIFHARFGIFYSIEISHFIFSVARSKQNNLRDKFNASDESFRYEMRTSKTFPTNRFIDDEMRWKTHWIAKQKLVARVLFFISLFCAHFVSLAPSVFLRFCRFVFVRCTHFFLVFLFVNFIFIELTNSKFSLFSLA